MQWTSSLFFLFIGRQAWAHGEAEGAHADGWEDSIWSWFSLAVLLLLRPRYRSYFAAAMGALFLALVWPLETMAARSFAAHMAQHMLIIAVAAPLLVASRPAVPLLKGVMAAGHVIRLLTKPHVAFLLHGLAIWLGHAPAVLQAATDHPFVHFLEHAVLLGTAVLLWWSLRQRGRVASGASSLWTLGTMIHTSILGALLTFAPRLLYPAYTLEDQQLAGLVMWVPGGLLYLAAALSFAAAWMGAQEQRA